MVRWGKKSKSYSVFLNALYQCKQLFDLSIQNQKVDKGITEIVDRNKNNKNQILPIKFSSKKRVRNTITSTEKITLVKNRISVYAKNIDIDVYRGTWNRFRKNLLFFNRNSKNTSSSFSSKSRASLSIISDRDLEIKVRFSENLYSSSFNLCTTAHLNSQLEKGHTFLSQQTHSAAQRFSLNKRLISRRVGLKVPLLSEFLKQNITTKKFEIESLIFRGLRTDTLILGFASLASACKFLQSRILYLNSNLLSSYLKREQSIDLSVSIRANNEKLIGCAQSSKEQDFIKIPRSVLLKKKNTSAKIYQGFYGLERTTIGIDSVTRVSPSVEVRKVRIGGATYAVPYVPHNKRQEGLGIRWLIACASLKRERSKHSSDHCLANELVESLKNQGESMKKRDQSHQIAAANRAYTRYRWW